ncbi:MAG: CDP-glycerol glycerophosphotransferase family protein, partial [Simkaniaceae bacterium]|nr:CDP-glycerol glycerophosphotransferase family protein [Simkaniaceae bacterium]
HNAVISSQTCHVIEQTIGIQEKLQGKPVLPVWCPHGNSDKGHRSLLMEALESEKIALIYGDKMMNFIKKKGAYNDRCHYLHIGNYRKLYYEKMKPFLTKIAKETIPFGKKNYLYAPTWNDAESSSTFVETFPQLIDATPDDVTLIVKLHPNDYLRQESDIFRLILKYEDNKGIFFLRDFPPIYPLLDLCDGYIGDASSIGYDMLFFKKPLFFTSHHPSPIHGCGEVITDYSKLFKQESQDRDREKESLYNETFGPEVVWNAFEKTFALTCMEELETFI